MPNANVFKAVIRPRRSRPDSVEDVRLELFNWDGSPAEFKGGGGGGGAVSQIVQGQVALTAPGSDTLFWNDPGLFGLGIDLSEYVGATELLLPRGLYLSTFDWYIDPGVDEGANDQDRSLHLNLAGAPGDWVGPMPWPRDWGINKGEGSWAEAPSNMQHIVHPFAIWAEHQTAQLYVTSSASDPVPFSIDLMIAKIADLPEE